jgi:hypothetical protein
MGRKGMLSLGGARGNMGPGPCRLWHFLVFSTIEGCHEGYIRLGVCKACSWGQMNPEARTVNTTRGLCMEDALQPRCLCVSGARGGDHEAPGKPTPAAGSRAAPSTAEPQH